MIDPLYNEYEPIQDAWPASYPPPVAGLRSSASPARSAEACRDARGVWLGVLAVIVALSLALFLSAAALGQEAAPSAAAAFDPLEVVCRVSCPSLTPEGEPCTDSGSGTLVFSHDVYRGVVLTNAHVVHGATGPITVTFADGEQVEARLLVANEVIDAATLEIPPTTRKAATWSAELPTGPLHGYGFGSGQLARLDGEATNQVGGSKTSVCFSSQFRQGDSGGPMFDDAGMLCGLIWATSPELGGLFVHPKHLAEFLEPLTRVGESPTPGTDAIAAVAANVQPTQYYSSCGPNGCPPQQQSSGWRIFQPAQPQQSVPINATPITQRPATNPAPACGCPAKWAALELRLAELAAAKATPGPAGPAGPPGPAGKDGKSVDADELARQVAVLVLKQLPPATPPATSSVSHYVLVADEGADYWPRLNDEFRRARESYSGLRFSGVPDVPVGTLPQLVAYRDGKPMGAFRGRRDVSDALARIAGGKAPLP